jgi:molybdopterin biosynthesis enzyme MoaB
MLRDCLYQSTQTGGTGLSDQHCTFDAGQTSSRLEQEMGFSFFELIRALSTASLTSQRVMWQREH